MIFHLCGSDAIAADVDDLRARLASATVSDRTSHFYAPWFEWFEVFDGLTAWQQEVCKAFVEDEVMSMQDALDVARSVAE